MFTNIPIIPDDIINRIMHFYYLFQGAEAMNRLIEFQMTYGKQWLDVMIDIRTNTPRYRFIAKTYSEQALTLSMFAPDCNIRGFFDGAQFFTWHMSCQRKAISLESPNLRGALRNEIIEPLELL